MGWHCLVVGLRPLRDIVTFVSYVPSPSLITIPWYDHQSVGPIPGQWVTLDHLLPGTLATEHVISLLD